MSNLRNKRYIWLPAILLLYGITMAVFFGRELIAAGRWWQLAVTMGVDIIVCILLFIFLKKKSKGKYTR